MAANYSTIEQALEELRAGHLIMVIDDPDRENEGVLTHSFDLDAIREMRHSWGVFRDRRPEMYGAMKSFGR